jgi:XTP/dITP diphosphohydrolase
MENFDRLLEVMRRLRAECPWDREQTIQSLRNNTIEETYELADAIAGEDWDAIRGELGDLLLHVVFYACIATEQGRFTMDDVIEGLVDKLVYRHPHVFADVSVNDSDDVSKNWEALKLKEKSRRGGVLGGVPRGLPSMVKAFRVGQKAAAAGFDWERREDVWDKVREEIDEVATEMQSGSGSGLEDEFGDLFFALVNAARLYGIDPEMALERTNRKFIGRFEHIESRAAGRPLRDFTPEQLDAWWQEAKKTV